MMALVLTVSGSREDGNPAEDSDRVRFAAAVALEHCLACYADVQPVPPPPPPVVVPPPPVPLEGVRPPMDVPPPAETVPPATPSAATAKKIVDYYTAAQSVPLGRVLQVARATLQKNATSPVQQTMAVARMDADRSGLISLVADALIDRSPSTAAGPQVGTTGMVRGNVPATGSAAPRGLLQLAFDGNSGTRERVRLSPATETPAFMAGMTTAGPTAQAANPAPAGCCKSSGTACRAPQTRPRLFRRRAIRRSSRPARPRRPPRAVRSPQREVRPSAGCSRSSLMGRRPSNNPNRPILVLPRLLLRPSLRRRRPPSRKPPPPVRSAGVRSRHSRWATPLRRERMFRASPTASRPPARVAKIEPPQPACPCSSPVATDGLSVPRLLFLLRESANPFDREAVVTLLAGSGRATPDMAAALPKSADSDSSPVVRTACLRALVALKVEDAALLTLVKRAQDDSDPRAALPPRRYTPGFSRG